MVAIEIRDSDRAYLVLYYENMALAQTAITNINRSQNAKASIIPEEEE